MAVDTISQSIQKISHSVVDYAGKYAFRSPVLGKCWSGWTMTHRLLEAWSG